MANSLRDDGYDEVAIAGFDAFMRAGARFIQLRRARSLPYDPRGPKRTGDFNDIRLLSLLGLGVRICTGDTRLINHVKHTGSPQAVLLMTVDDVIRWAASERRRAAA